MLLASMWNSFKRECIAVSAGKGAILPEEGLDVAPQPQIALAHFEEGNHFRFLEAKI